MGGNRSARVRLGVAVGTALGLLVTLFMTWPSYGGTAAQAPGKGDFRKAYDVASMTAAALKEGKQTVYFPDGTHLHLKGAHLKKDGSVSFDPEVKNAIARSGAEEGTGDPTTKAQARANEKAVAAQRAVKGPALKKTYVRRGHGAVPADRYEMAGGCYGLQGPNGRWLRLNGTTTGFTGTSIGAGTPVFFKATDLGTYLLHVTGHKDLARSGATVTPAAAPSAAAVWTVTKIRKGTFRFAQAGGGLSSSGGFGTPAAVRLRLRSGCTAYPEISTGVTGAPFAGVSPMQEVRGYVDAHTHGMAFEFLGGDVHCGKPWDKYGVEYALKDCPDHYLTGGKGAVMEAFLSGKPSHDPVGWPTFKDWPAPDSLTHEGTYYEWLERSWRAGQRILVNLLVENDQLCKIYPLKRNSCDDMDSIRLQAKDMRLLQRYVDAQSGGPGWGWYRIVTDPAMARQTINRGKLAVVMGIETSVPFGCTMKLDVPACDVKQIDSQIDEVRRLGVRQMELVNKFDNALSGVAGDTGSTGNLVNTANFLETGSFWSMAHCAVQDPDVHDRDQTTVPDNPGTPAQDALFGAIVKLNLPTNPLPVYPSPHHCNTRGLTALGDHTIRSLAQRHMIFDPDHMSVKARKASLDLIDRLRYPGVVSSHSWSTPDAYPRIYKEGGFITPYAGDSTGFVAKWRQHLKWADKRFYFGFGYGADINGLGAQGDPRPGAATHNPVRYPFKGLGGVTVNKQVSGSRVYDINKDGVAHYGLYPDWIEDLRKLAGNAIVDDMARGSEAYLEMWERAEGVKPNACVNPGQRHAVSFFKRFRKGATSWRVLQKAGQPGLRRGQTYSYCAGSVKSPHRVKITFNRYGRLLKVTKTA